MAEGGVVDLPTSASACASTLRAPGIQPRLTDLSGDQFDVLLEGVISCSEQQAYGIPL